MTNIPVPRRLRQRVQSVGVQLYWQDKLSKRCGKKFAYFADARSEAYFQGCWLAAQKAYAALLLFMYGPLGWSIRRKIYDSFEF